MTGNWTFGAKKGADRSYPSVPADDKQMLQGANEDDAYPYLCWHHTPFYISRYIAIKALPHSQ
eukprot:scaffold672832_cov60-Prasinocladus_malaysianus.AAC.1